MNHRNFRTKQVTFHCIKKRFLKKNSIKNNNYYLKIILKKYIHCPHHSLIATKNSENGSKLRFFTVRVKITVSMLRP